MQVTLAGCSRTRTESGLFDVMAYVFTAFEEWESECHASNCDGGWRRDWSEWERTHHSQLEMKEDRSPGSAADRAAFVRGHPCHHTAINYVTPQSASLSGPIIPCLSPTVASFTKREDKLLRS